MFETITYKSNTLGWILRSARKDAGLSLRGLAQKSGVSASQIHNIETSKFDVSIENYLRICLSLGLPPGLPLEDSLLPNPGFYAKLIRNGKDCDEFNDEWDDTKFKEFASRRLGCVSAVFHYVLICSRPLSFCERIPYPYDEMKDVFLDISRKVESYTSLDRLNEITILRERTLEVLRGNGLIFPEMLRDLFDQFSHGERIALWVPFFDEESAKFIH